MTTWIYDDGGRAAAGFRGKCRDCVTRAIAIATERPYREVYRDLRRAMGTDGGSPRDGVPKATIRRYLAAQGWEWVPTMRIGQGCTVHLRADELPAGRLVVSVSRHLVAVIDGVVRDTYDPARHGGRCVYGYYRRA